MENKWKAFSTERAFEYAFWMKPLPTIPVGRPFSKGICQPCFLGILIACLGLLGLATFSAQQRIKEIGIRKVLGASVTGLVALLSKDFLKLVLIALFGHAYCIVCGAKMVA